MFFVILIVLLWALFAFKSPFDSFGWLMIVGFAWFAGFMDCKLYAKIDRETDRVMPPGDEPTNDSAMFRS